MTDRDAVSDGVSRGTWELLCALRQLQEQAVATNQKLDKVIKLLENLQ